MSLRGDQHVVPYGDLWAVRGAGNHRVTSIHDTQSEAIGVAREIARNQRGELFVHGRNGQIRHRDSTGLASDPFPPRG